MNIEKVSGTKSSSGCNGSSMAQAWLKHGSSMAQAWLKYGSSMAQAWLKHGSSMAQTWLKHVKNGHKKSSDR